MNFAGKSAGPSKPGTPNICLSTPSLTYFGTNHQAQNGRHRAEDTIFTGKATSSRHEAGACSERVIHVAARQRGAVDLRPRQKELMSEVLLAHKTPLASEFRRQEGDGSGRRRKQ